MLDKNFLGMDGLIWWFGVVEDRQDPLALGRVRVRVVGWHSSSLADIPTEDLPWAAVVQASNNPSFSTPKEGETVVGFFVDGRNGQMPVVWGVIPGFNTQENTTGQGFNDLRTEAVLANSPKKPTGRTYKSDGSGITVAEGKARRYPHAEDLQNQSLSGVTRMEVANTAIQARKDNLDKNIVSADGQKWSEPYPAYNALYPYNHATETESGHLFELDDTPGSERININHRSGSYKEWFPSGSVVEKITKSNYTIVMGTDYCHVMGKVLLTVDQDVLIRVLGDAKIEVCNDADIKVSGSMKIAVKEDLQIKAKSLNIDVSDAIDIISGAATSLTSGANMNLKAGSNMLSTAAAKNEILGGGTVDIKGSAVNIDISADSADDAVAAGIDDASARATASTGQASEETVPTPILTLDFAKNLDAYTGTQYKQSLLQNEEAEDDANTAAPARDTNDCNYDANTKTFLVKSGWAIGSKGLKLIKNIEKLAKKIGPDQIQAYPDPVTKAQPYTIGYGTTGAVVDEVITLETVWTVAKSESALGESINNIFLPALKKAVTVRLTQNQIDACLSLIYNIGETNFRKSKVRRFINDQNWCAAGDAFLLYNKAKNPDTLKLEVVAGLTNRRKQERTLFLT